MRGKESQLARLYTAQTAQERQLFGALARHTALQCSSLVTLQGPAIATLPALAAPKQSNELDM
jgi:hypothetical protein